MLGRLIPDIFFLCLLGLFWFAYVGPIVIREQRQGVDILRDLGSVVNIQHGQPFTDPAYLDESLWYPPLSPLIVAGMASLFDVSPADWYRWSQLVFNWIIPAGLFLVTRIQWGRQAAILATITLLLAMPWWQAEVAHGQPSIHAIVWGWVGLLLYVHQHRRASYSWALACGLFQGISFWHHPFVPALLTVGFVLQTVWAGLRSSSPPDEQIPLANILWRNLLIIGVTLLVACPILYQMLGGPVRNPEPREYLAPELQTVEFALMHGNPWLWGMGLVGLVSSVRRADLGSRILVSCLLVALFAQIPGYARLYGGEWASHVPTLVPHEFQRLFQLGWAVSIGIGIDATLRVLTARVGFLQGRRLAAAVLALVAGVATGGWGLLEAPANLRRYLNPELIPPRFQEAGQWILHNTDINDVFACEPDMAFHWLNPQTGRKVWILPRGHSNPRVDWKHRDRVLAALQEAPTPEAFWRLARQHGIDYFIPSAEWRPRAVVDPNVPDAPVPIYFKLVYGDLTSVAIYQVLNPGVSEQSPGR